MRHARMNSRFLLPILVISLTASMFSDRQTAAAQQATLDQLEARLQQQYATIEDRFAHGPAKMVYPPNPRERIHRWQEDLAQSFAEAGKTIDEILKLNPPDAEKWRERSDTMWLYSQPSSPPSSRTVYGASEVQRKARLLDPPAAVYPDAARLAKAK